MNKWIVAVTSFGGSMSETFFGQTMLGPFDEQTAKAVADEYNNRADAMYDRDDEHAAEAFEVKSQLADVTAIVDGLLVEEQP